MHAADPVTWQQALIIMGLIVNLGAVVSAYVSVIQRITRLETRQEERDRARDRTEKANARRLVQLERNVLDVLRAQGVQPRSAAASAELEEEDEAGGRAAG